MPRSRRATAEAPLEKPREPAQPARRTEPATEGIATRLADAGLLAVFLGLVFLLGCFPLKDTDFWWHLRTGDIIRQTWRTPLTDWYTFGAEGHDWIDLHWLFEVLLSWGYQHAGIPGLNLAKCAITCVSLLVLIAARRPGWPLWVMLLAWLPALFVLSGRMYVRPETLTLLYLSVFLAVISRWKERPRLAWILPFAQVLWVNTQGLFVLGPVVLVFGLIDAALTRGALAASRRSWWRTVGLASLATGAACLLNPYGLLGALFPIQLARTMADPVFSESIAELMPVAEFARQVGLGNLPLQMHLAAMALGGLSFLLPVVWGGWARLRQARGGADSTLAKRKRKAKPSAGATPADSSPVSLFRLLLFVAFSALSLKATRNSHQFAAVVGAVTAWNFGEWAGAVRASRGARRPATPAGAVVPRLVTLVVLLAAIALVGSGTFYAWAGEGRTIGLGEEPLWFPRQAVEIAGRPGMPQRFVCFHNGHAAFYEYRWGPDRKVYTDARLEVMGPELFGRYLDLERRLIRKAPGWSETLASLGNPAVLVDLVHGQFAGMAATLLEDPSWRCVWLDPVAAVFVHEDYSDAGPAVDLAARHYRPDPARDPQGRAALIASAKALSAVALHLQLRGQTESARPLVLLGLDHARKARSLGPSAVEPWRLIGIMDSLLDSVGDPDNPSPRFRLPFDPVFDLPTIRSTSALNQAIERDPHDLMALLTLSTSYQSRAMYEESYPISLRLTELHREGENLEARRKRREQAVIEASRAKAALGEAPDTSWRNLAELDQAVSRLLQSGRARSAAELLERAYPAASRPWEVTDRIATLRLHLGEPEAAKAAWASAVDPPRPALVASRLGMAELARDDLAAARQRFEEATRLDPELFEAWYGLAVAEQDAANAPGAVDAAARAVETAPNTLARQAAETILRLARHGDQARSNSRISDGSSAMISRDGSSSTAAPSP
jgi:tetratricopeptide (TPR) repeat protein